MDLLGDWDFVGLDPTIEDGERVLDHHWYRRPGEEWKMLPACTVSELLAATVVIGPVDVWPTDVMPCNISNRDTICVLDEFAPDGGRGIASFERKPRSMVPVDPPSQYTSAKHAHWISPEDRQTLDPQSSDKE